MRFPEDIRPFLSDASVVLVELGGFLEWIVPADHGEEDHGCGKEVGGLASVRLLQVNLGSHVAFCSHLVRVEAVTDRILNEFGSTKVDKLNIKVFCYYEVLWFYISMSHMISMTLFYSFYKLSKEIASYRLCEPTHLFHVLLEIWAFPILEHYVRSLSGIANFIAFSIRRLIAVITHLNYIGFSFKLF